MNRPYVLSVCGVRTNCADAGWFDRAETFFEGRGVAAGSYRYATAATLRFWGQSRRVRELFYRLTEFRSFDVSVLAHSNGAELITAVLREYKSLRLNQIHLFAPACDADFDANGLNDAIRTGRVQRVYVYGSGADFAMKAARFSRVVTFGLWGYGDLGGVGPTRVDPLHAHHVITDMRPNVGHSDWFNPTNFGNSMANVANSIGLP